MGQIEIFVVPAVEQLEAGDVRSHRDGEGRAMAASPSVGGNFTAEGEFIRYEPVHLLTV